MLTQRGRTVLALAGGLAFTARLLALREVAMLAAMLIAVLGIGLATMLLRQTTIAVSRRVTPNRTSVGSELRVELTVGNRGSVGGGPVLLEDALPERLAPPARLSLASLSPRSERKITYALRPAKRGVFRVGPLDLLMTDPFGLFIRRQELPGTATIVVYPPFERLRTMPKDVQRAGVVRRSPLLGTGDEFFALRAYEEGDDLRKVHWPTSLRHRELLIKQEELLQLPGVLVLVDTCAHKHRGESIEAAISACASVATMAIDQGLTLELVAASGPLLRGHKPTEDEALEALALLEPSAMRDVGPALIRARARRPMYTSLVVITPGLSAREASMLAETAARAAGGVTVHVDADSFAARAPDPSRRRRLPAELARVGLPVVRLSSSDSFKDVWEVGVTGGRARSAGRAGG